MTYEKLEEIGIESVVFEKDQVGDYKLDFIKIPEVREEKELTE